WPRGRRPACPPRPPPSSRRLRAACATSTRTFRRSSRAAPARISEVPRLDYSATVRRRTSSSHLAEFHSMALLKIARMGNPILKKIAEPVADPTDPQIAKLAADMKETLEDIGGNGLAAPQVYVSKRIVVYRIAAHQIPAGVDFKPLPWTVLVNPVIEPLTDEKKPIWERCLSVPGLHGVVPRYTRVRCTAQALDGSCIERVTRGFH